MLHTALPDAGSDGRARATALERLRLAEVTPTAIVEFVSRGRCLVVGTEAEALEFVRQIGGRLECTVAVPGDVRPDVDRVEGTLVVRGGRPVVRGALGNFDVALETPEGRLVLGAMLLPPVERFDLVVDFGATALLQQAMKPLGYYSLPGPDPEARATLAATLPDMRGEFEKPRFFNYNPEICAHGHSSRDACSRCIDFCPAEAIVSIGNKVQVNPYLCQGGGTCATVCPSGAMTYAYPVPGDLLRALRELLRDYREAGGAAPVLLFHDETSGNALGDGFAATMPEHVLPVPIEEIGATGMDVWLACLAYGAEAVVLLTCDATPPQVVEALQEQVVFTHAILAGMGHAETRLRLLNADQPAATRAGLDAQAAPSHPAATFAAPPADKRGTLRLALAHLQAHAPAPKRVTAMPPGAPFGEIRVDPAACTLCMSCVSACPTFALQDGRGLPQLNFREWSCVQCGLCARICPENAITLNPRLLNDAEARERPRTVHEEQPVCCLSCGKPFATRSVLEKLGRKLEGHWMFQGEEARRRLQMCEDCRVRDMFTAEARRGR